MGGLAAADGHARVAAGWQGLLREFAADGWVRRVDPARSPLLKRRAWCAPAWTTWRPAWASRRRAFAPRATIVLTAGDRGGLAMRESRLVRYPAIQAPQIVDPTGAGDVFLAALMAAWLRWGELVTSRALRFAAAAGSCAVEGAGLAGVPTEAQVIARLHSTGNAPGQGVPDRRPR